MLLCRRFVRDLLYIFTKNYAKIGCLSVSHILNCLIISYHIQRAALTTFLPDKGPDIQSVHANFDELDMCSS